MTVKKKPKKKPVSGIVATGAAAVAEEIVSFDRADLKKKVAEVAEGKSSYREIADEVYKETKIPITQPTVGKYLEEEWGKDFAKKKAKMSERRSMFKKWNKNFELVRLNVGKKFHKEYISSTDGMMYNREKNVLESIPIDITDTQWKLRKRDIINFSKERMFGYTPNAQDLNKLGTYDPSVLSIVKRQLRRRVLGLAQDEYKRLEKKTFDDEMETRDMKGMDLEEKDAFQKKVMREVRKGLKPERAKINNKAEEDFKKAFDTLRREGLDNRSATLLGKDMLERDLCPAFSSSDKKYRGKQRMFAMKGIDPETGKPYIFSKAVHNIPDLLWSHPKRLQIMSHNLSKKLPELLHGEDPIVEGKQSDIKGINLRVRLPRDPKEDVLTREAGIIITENVAKKFRYFNVVEKGHIIAESIDQLPQTWRVNKPPGTINPIKTHADFEARVDEALEIQRGDPLTLSRFKDLDGNPGYKEAKHSGQLIYLGQPRNKQRGLTVDKDRDPQGRSKVVVSFVTQEYIIVREDNLKIGDKIISRNGLKGVIAEIVPNLGKDKKGRDHEAVVNLGEVWREADPKSPDFKLEDETFFKQGKKKSGVVREHEASDGQVFFFLIDKMAQDQSTSGLRMSTTMLSGLWEWFLYDVMGEGKRYTQAELNAKLEEFVGRYFGDKGTFVPSLKAMHYKAVKKGDKVRIEIDEREPLPDSDGDVIYLPHTYAGRTYDYAYIPNFISRIYFDGSTLREYYQMDSSRKGTTSASGYYYQFIVRQIKNRTYIFPRNEDAVNLVAVPYYGKNPEDYDTVIMDLMDFINAGGNPYDKNPTVTFRKEPVTGKFSIQTHPVKIDKTGKYNGCYDPETEILTDNGWKYFKDLEKQDKVATIDDNGNTIFVNPVDYIEYQYKGKMCKIDTKMVNLLVTPNHQMYASKRKYIKNKDYYDDFDLVEAQNLGSRFKLKLNGNWEGKETDLFKINGISKTRNIMSNNQYGSFNCDQTHNYPSLIFDMDTWMEFMGYYLSEGSVRNRNRLFISQRDLDNREKIENCLDRLEIKYHIRKDGFEINNIVLATYLTQFGKASNKFIPRELLNASKRQLMILYNALMLGDGTKNGSTYYTSSKKLANDFQELVFRIGYSAGIYIRNRIGNSVAINGKVSGYTRNLSYAVGIRRERNTPIVNIGKSRVEWVDYDDTVYCVEVPTKSHTLYVRRNGKPVWSGNCIAIHPSVALKATVDYDGDQVVVFTPSIGHAVVKLDDEVLKELKGLKKSDYTTRFSDFYDKAKKIKYAKTEGELGVRSAQYNQETGEIENTKIQQLGGLRKRSLLFYGSKLPEPIKYGSKKDPREKMLTPELVNHVCDVEKILKMREPRWLVRELEKTKWDDLTKEQKNLVEDYHIRRELGRRLQQLVDSEKLERLMKIIQNEKSFIEDNRLIDRGTDPKGLEIQIGNRLVDRVIWQQLKNSDILIGED